MNNFILLSLIAQAIVPIASMYNKNSPVIQLTADNFHNKVVQAKQVTLVEFYAPWCGHCKNLKPIYESVASKVKDLAQVAAIDCDEEKNKPICAQYGIQGFPTIKLFPSSVKSKGKKKVPSDYNGARTKKEMMDFVKNAIPNLVKRVTTGPLKSKMNIKLEDFLALENKNNEFTPKALLFTEKSSTTSLYKAIAVEFSDRMEFSEVRKTEKGLLEKYNVSKFPTLVVIPSKDLSEEYDINKLIVFDGELNAKNLKQFVEKHSLPSKEKSEKPKKKPKPEKKQQKEKKGKKEEEEEEGEVKPRVEPFDPSVTELIEQEEFEKECINKEGICVLNFIKKENVEELTQQLKQIKKNLYDLKLNNNLPSNTPKLNMYYSIPMKHTFLFKQFDISNQDNPTVILIHPKRKLYAIKSLENLEGYQTQVEEYLTQALNGKIKLYSYTFNPKLKKVKKGKKNQDKDEL
ncbi:thioredoxin-domain-containing protein [Neoconidiobolus thromboides FSU 785]|nr:thioredoxin-domain-containing protein [Neoconidiobolus thromboides FSU 785]